jgi:hypothetical protein
MEDNEFTSNRLSKTEYRIISTKIPNYKPFKHETIEEEIKQVIPTDINTDRHETSNEESKNELKSLLESLKLSFNSLIIHLTQDLTSQSQSDPKDFSLKLKNLKKFDIFLKKIVNDKFYFPRDFSPFQEANFEKKHYLGYYDKKSLFGFAAVRSQNVTYIGQVVDMKYEGHGALIHKNGSFFIGNWKDGRKEGFGRYIGCDGAQFTGNYVDGKKSGLGFVKYPNGDIFHGNFCNDVQNGQGEYRYAKSDYYEYDRGLWKNGKMTVINDLRRKD